MTQDLRDRLLRAEDDFMESLLQGEEHLSSYHTFWATLESDFSHAVTQQDLDDETVSIGRNVASRIDVIARCFLDITQKQQELTNELHEGVEAILRGIEAIQISDPVSYPRTRRARGFTPVTDIPSSRDEDHEVSPPFLAPAYHWLLQNLQNPYPSSDIKSSLARSSGCPVSTISSWFANARRRMGWTTICRDHFRNSRSDAVDAASKILATDDLHHTFPPDLVHAFIAMRVNAEGLYSSLFTKSALAGELDLVVKNVSEVDKTQLDDEKRRQMNIVERERGTRRNEGILPSQLPAKFAEQDCYSSPQRSHSLSPVPTLDESLTDESEDEEDVSPPILAGRKRRSSSSEFSHASPPTSTARPIKRLRSSTSSTSSTSWSASSLPSPPTSVDSDCHGRTPFPVSITQTCTNSATSRKRRLSTTDAYDIPTRSRPRLHVVSDPLPRPHVESEYSVDEWFNTNFDALFALPPPVDAIEPDHSTQWEIELFSNYSLPQDLQRRSSKASTPFVQVPQTSTSPDLADLENLLQSIGSDQYVGYFETIQQTTISLDAVSAPPELPLSSDVSRSIDWTTLLNHEQTFEPSIGCIFPPPYVDSQPLSEIDLSVLQLPKVTATTTPTTTSSSDHSPTSKQAKLHQLQAMQEAVRQMERELQSEGIAI